MKRRNHIDILRALGATSLVAAFGATAACYVPSGDYDARLQDIRPGERVSVRGEIDDVHDARAFTIEPEARFEASGDVLVLDERRFARELNEGDDVYVGGVVQHRDVTRLPADLEGEVIGDGSGAVAVLVATAVEVAPIDD